jgi:hypothetical protein
MPGADGFALVESLPLMKPFDENGLLKAVSLAVHLDSGIVR